jgi:hypothetical protein
MPATTASKAVLELNGLVLFKYSSIYGYAFEVLTQNGRERIAHGDNEEAVLRKAVDYLDAKAVLSGVPVKVPGGNYTSRTTNDALEALIYQQSRAMEQMKLKYLEEERKQRVFNISQFPTYDSNVPGGVRLLEHGQDPGFSVSGPEPEKEV